MMTMKLLDRFVSKELITSLNFFHVFNGDSPRRGEVVPGIVNPSLVEGFALAQHYHVH